MKPLLVGEANPYGADPHYALYPDPPLSAGGRLCFKVLGLTEDDYLERFDRVNLCPTTWSIRTARAKATELVISRSFGDPPMTLLGSKVCEAFGLAFRPFTFDGGAFVILPHPSGLSRAWNEPGAYERARAVLREAGVLPAAGAV